MFKINKKNVRRVVITGIASIALVAPLALGGVQPNVNANAGSLDEAALQGSAETNKQDGEWDAQQAKVEQNAEKQYTAKTGHKVYGIKQLNSMPKKQVLKNMHLNTNSNASQSSSNETTSNKAVRNTKKQMNNADTQPKRRMAVKHAKKQVKTLKKSNKHESTRDQIKSLRKMINKMQREIKRISHKLAGHNGHRAHKSVKKTALKNSRK